MRSCPLLGSPAGCRRRGCWQNNGDWSCPVNASALANDGVCIIDTVQVQFDEECLGRFRGDLKDSGEYIINGVEKKAIHANDGSMCVARERG